MDSVSEDFTRSMLTDAFKDLVPPVKQYFAKKLKIVKERRIQSAKQQVGVNDSQPSRKCIFFDSSKYDFIYDSNSVSVLRPVGMPFETFSFLNSFLFDRNEKWNTW